MEGYTRISKTTFYRLGGLSSRYLARTGSNGGWIYWRRNR